MNIGIINFHSACSINSILNLHSFDILSICYKEYLFSYSAEFIGQGAVRSKRAADVIDVPGIEVDVFDGDDKKNEEIVELKVNMFREQIIIENLELNGK